MSKDLTIALDAMGGDYAPDVVIEGAEIARERYPDASFILFGRKQAVGGLLAARPALAAVTQVVHTQDVVQAEDKPSQALRRGRESSMGLAIKAVADGEAQVAVSAGNTGALMALAKFVLRTMPGIDRPALASLFPTARGESVMLDLGANIDCSEDNLVEFALMGAAFARTVLGLGRPTVALLNVGVEELKGNETVKNAGQRLKDAPLPMDFAGFMEGDGIGAGDVDVVVTDGFTGNVALKTAEGTARLIRSLLTNAFESSTMARVGYVFARRGLESLKDHLDPNLHNGAVFLGLNGLVVKSHGGASALGFATAIGTAIDMARHDLCQLIGHDLKNFSGSREPGEPSAAMAGKT